MLSVYGADFSGAMNPNIFYVQGILDGSHLTLKSYWACDDRLDLYHAIVRSENAIWGLDFPFSVAAGAIKQLGFESRDEMLNALVAMTRQDFAAFIAACLDDYPRKCTEYDECYCRHTDAVVNAHSPFKKVNPNLRVMLYSGLRLLRYLSDGHVNVYPFGEYAGTRPTVYEIYPSYAWRQVGMKRSTDIDRFIDQFNALGLILVSCEFATGVIDNQDLADSIVACVMMAAAYVTQTMHRGWDYRLPIFSDDEWEWRHIEGLIVRF